MSEATRQLHPGRFLRPGIEAAVVGQPMHASPDVRSHGNVYVADTGNHIIRKIAIDGTVSTLAGHAPAFGSSDGKGDVARFFSPAGIAVDSAGNVFVPDTSNHTIRKITAAREVTTIAGAVQQVGFIDGPGLQARFNSPRQQGAHEMYGRDSPAPTRLGGYFTNPSERPRIAP